MNVSEATGRSAANAAIAAPPVDQPARCTGRVDAERAQQRGGVVGPVAQAAGGVDRDALGVAEAAHVGRDQP